MAIIPVNPIPPDRRLYTNITPFTVRDNATYISILEGMRAYINNVLIPFINDNVGELDEKWHEEVEALISNVEALISNVEAIAETMRGAVADAQAAQEASETARDQAEQFASDAAEIQDTAITSIFVNGSSEFRGAFDSVIDGIVKEDSNDPGTFIVSSEVEPEPSQVMPDPSDPGFFV